MIIEQAMQLRDMKRTLRDQLAVNQPWNEQQAKEEETLEAEIVFLSFFIKLTQEAQKG